MVKGQAALMKDQVVDVLGVGGLLGESGLLADYSRQGVPFLSGFDVHKTVLVSTHLP